jgi:ribose 5-phosphate isomerase B
MRIVLAADHAGFELKQNLLEYVQGLGHQVQDAGTDSTAPVDYPDYAEAAGMAIRRGQADRGVLVCGSGVGASVAANKIPGIRAGLCHDVELARELVRAFLGATFSGEERHLRRLEKVHKLEEGVPA